MEAKWPSNLSKDGFKNQPVDASQAIDPSQLDDVRTFIRKHFTKQEHTNLGVNSYHLDHIVKRHMPDRQPIGMGEIIAAMILEGYKFERQQGHSPNAYFNIDSKCLKLLDVG